MILDRQKEIVHRARHRLVMAFITLEAHVATVDEINTENLGVRIKNRKAKIEANEDGFIIHSAQVLETDDQCEALVEKDPAVMQDVLTKLKDRNRASLNTGLSAEEQDILFESEDIVLQATGLPSRISIVFASQNQEFAKALRSLPFAKLTDYFSILNDKMSAINGRIHSVDITHKSAVSAHDFYRIASKSFAAGGFVATDGRRILADGHNMLNGMIMPVGNYRLN